MRDYLNGWKKRALSDRKKKMWRSLWVKCMLSWFNALHAEKKLKKSSSGWCILTITWHSSHSIIKWSLVEIIIKTAIVDNFFFVYFFCLLTAAAETDGWKMKSNLIKFLLFFFLLFEWILIRKNISLEKFHFLIWRT